MTGSVTIRDAERADLERVVALIAGGTAPGATPEDDPGPPLDAAYVAAFDAIQASPHCRLLVAEREGVVVGTFQLAILPNLAHRGRPVAQLESLLLLREANTDTGSGRQPQHCDSGHAFLPGHAFPLLGRSDVVVDDHPVRAEPQPRRLHR